MPFNQGELIPSLDEYYQYRPVDFDVDIGSIPGSILEDGINFIQYAAGDDTVLYTDVPINSKYSADLPLSIELFYKMEAGTSAGTVRFLANYATSPIGGAVDGSSFTSAFADITVTADTDMHKVHLENVIPELATMTQGGILTLQLGRDGTVDTSTDNFMLAYILVYQVAA